MINRPFLIVNPKAYLYGNSSLELAKECDRLSQKYEIDIIFTAQHVDLRMISEQCKNLIVTAQHSDPINIGRGMGHILIEGLKDAGVRACVINHAEHEVTFENLEKTINRLRDNNIMSIVCANTYEDCSKIAKLSPDIMIIEASDNIESGQLSSDEYIKDTINIVRNINRDIKIIHAAGVSTAQDVEHILELGADGTGGTSSIVKAKEPVKKVQEMIEAMIKFK